MKYSINVVKRDYADKNSLCSICIQVINRRVLVRVATPYKVRADQFTNGQVINHPNQLGINGNLRKVIAEIEGRLIDFLRTGEPSKQELTTLANNSTPKKTAKKFTDFIKTHNKEMAGKMVPGTIAIFASLIPDIEAYDPSLTFDKINVSWLNLYEQYQRSIGWGQNTIHKKMTKIKTLLCRAADAGHIEEKQFKKYKVPLYIQNIPEYISEIEMQAIKDLVDTVQNPRYKMAGYYFLLACYAGYRISDLRKFDHTKSVKEDKIVLRAKKNKVIVLMPLHTRLAQILNYVKDNPMKLNEPDMRGHVKDIVKMAGINRHIKIHTARHSFAMMLMDNGFDLEEVAALLGVSLKTAAIYGHISNKRLENKVRSRLG